MSAQRSLPTFPRTRGDCEMGPRPCPHETCRHHLGAERAQSRGRRSSTTRETCALDVAERGPLTLDEVGEAMGLTRERVRQIEAKIVRKVRANQRPLGERIAAALADLDEERRRRPIE